MVLMHFKTQIRCERSVFVQIPSYDNLLYSASYTTQQFLKLYSSPDALRWQNISTLATALDLLDMAANSTADFFQSKGVSAQFVNEIVEGATRINYGQVRTFQKILRYVCGQRLL